MIAEERAQKKWDETKLEREQEYRDNEAKLKRKWRRRWEAWKAGKNPDYMKYKKLEKRPRTDGFESDYEDLIDYHEHFHDFLHKDEKAYIKSLEELEKQGKLEPMNERDKY